MPADRPDLSLVIPAYNEEDSIEQCVTEAAAAIARTGQTCEILVIDDGSTDATFERLKALRTGIPQLRALRLASNRGQSAALDAGFRNAAADVVVTLDADGQNDPNDIPRLLELLDRFDVVCGVRTQRRDNFVRRASSRIANFVRNRLSDENVTDTGCSLKAFKRSFLVRLKLYHGMHRFLPTLLKLDGARVAEVPVNHRPRRYGRTKYNVWNRVFKSFRDLLAVRWMKRRWIRYDIIERL